MEREQIIKTLECCSKGTCRACPLKEDYSPCLNTMAYSALSLIKELTDENERLRDELDKRPPKLVITKLPEKESKNV